ncbi:MAG: hypothetical protein H6Q04_684 [Acidobacteria bacterium]|nr:hypothetical protein [Acidobacteriota bacterium]
MGAHLSMTNAVLADQETELVSLLITRVSESGISEDHIPVVNLYVALKSKPLVLLAGPPESGKQALVQCVSQFLSGGGCEQYQAITGHPWWANRGDNLTLLTDLHSRFLTEKLFAILEEATLPENRDRMFVACLMHLSPAELLTFFREVAFQLRNGQIMRLGEAHLSAPIPYPYNLFLIGTMDTANFRWWDADFLAKTTVIQWSGSKTCTPSLDGIRSGGSEFLRFRICGRQAAYQKLHAVVGGQKNPARIIFRVVTLLRQHGITLSVPVMDEIVIYLANAWTSNGRGLFDPSLTTNLAIALDLVIAQILLASTADLLNKTAKLSKQLHTLFGREFPFSIAFLEGLE